MLFPILRDQLRFLRELGYDVHAASIDGPFGRRIHDDDGFPWTPLPLTRSFAPWPDWRALRFIERFCREKKFDIVHTHTPKGNVVGQWAARRAGVKHVLQTLHGFYFHDRMPFWQRRAWIQIERFSAKHSDHILCQNPEDVETAVRERIARPEQITLLGNGIDLNRYTPLEPDDPRKSQLRRALNIPPEALVVGMAGRFVAEKGFGEFLAAGELLAEKAPNLHLLAIGQRLLSERGGNVWSPPQSSKLAGKLTVLTDRDDMPELYACMDVHVLPSHREGFPRALMEGAAAGLPQVCTNIRGCRQTVAHGLTGLFIEVGDVRALAAAIQRLLDDAALRRQYGQAARAKALAEFDQRKVFEKVAECYRRLLKSKE
jgi:glycosyltransferase involved in cell wall biosynthesis